MNEEDEWGLRPLIPSEAARLRELAEAVGEDLSQFGLALYNREAPDRETAAGGLEIEVDAFDGAAGGIWLSWAVHPSLKTSARPTTRPVGSRLVPPRALSSVSAGQPASSSTAVGPGTVCACASPPPLLRDCPTPHATSGIITGMTGIQQDQLSQLWDDFRRLQFPPGFVDREPEGESMALMDTMLAGCVSVALERPLDDWRRDDLHRRITVLRRILPSLADDEYATQYFSHLLEMAVLAAELDNARGR
ncbi:hypothetical protein ABZ883_40950 [Streptomyces sp. NPDC046977]|uniref:hypothetical protein n=1 Tax=Streptomyces sp. NPDC046977 TaxID=3154703 RepID=UPI0033C4CA43